MSPSSRLVVFFIGENGEVVTDSVLLEIDDGLPNKVDHIFMRGVKNHFKDTFVTKWGDKRAWDIFYMNFMI